MNYIALRVFEFFDKKDKYLSMSRTINFLSIFQISLMIPFFVLINILTKVSNTDISYFNGVEYYIGIPIGLFFIAINTFIYKKKLAGEGLHRLKEKYHRDRYFLSVWAILLTPPILVFIVPVLYGVLNGTLHVIIR